MQEIADKVVALVDPDMNWSDDERAQFAQDVHTIMHDYLAGKVEKANHIIEGRMSALDELKKKAVNQWWNGAANMPMTSGEFHLAWAHDEIGICPTPKGTILLFEGLPIQRVPNHA